MERASSPSVMTCDAPPPPQAEGMGDANRQPLAESVGPAGSMSPTSPVSHSALIEGWVEAAVIFGVVPALLAAGVIPMGWRMWLLMLGFAAAMVMAWRGGASLRDWGLAPTHGIAPLLWTLAVGGSLWLLALAVLLLTHAASDQPLLPLLSNNPRLMGRIAVYYGLSVIFQELLFRGYFFWRYAPRAPATVVVAANSLIFGWVHVIYGSLLSVGLSTLGGVLFAGLYMRYASLPGVAVVHWLFGMAIFAAGYGHYFLPAKGVLRGP